jgi:protein arginine N-methyltransferase 5
LELTSRLPSDSRLNRWIGEPVRALILPTSIFQYNSRGQPVLSKRHQKFIISMFQFKVHIIITGFSKFLDGLIPYQYYVRYIFNNRPTRSHQEVIVIPSCHVMSCYHNHAIRVNDLT